MKLKHLFKLSQKQQILQPDILKRYTCNAVFEFEKSQALMKIAKIQGKFLARPDKVMPSTSVPCTNECGTDHSNLFLKQIQT